MINVRRLANSMTQQVNPNIKAILRVNTGYDIDDYGNQVSSYEDLDIKIQTQSLASKEKDHLGLTNRQGEFISVYAYGDINAIRRWVDKGSSQVLFAPYGEPDAVTWNVDKVLESYSTWVRLLLMRQ